MRSNHFLSQRAQVSLEFVILTGSVVIAALTIYALRGTIGNLAEVMTDWVDVERNASIAKATR